MELMTDNNFSQSLEFGKSLISGNKLDEALNWFVEMSKNFYNKEEVHFELGKIYYILQQYENAKREFEFIKNTQKNNYDFELLLAKVYRALNIDFTALKILLRLYDKYKNEEIEHEIITTLLLNKKFVLAIKFLLENNKDNKNLNGILHDFLAIVSRKVADNRFYKMKDSIIKLMRLFDMHTKQNEFLKVKNILLNELEIGNKEVVLKSKPRNLTVTLTNKCNLKCRMCRNITKGSFELSEQYINEIKDLMPYLQRIVWIGGEVFLYQHFFELFDLANTYQITQNISTNGLLITKDIMLKIFKSTNLELNLSIDSTNKQIYENIRLGANFDDLIKQLELLNSYKFNKQNIKLLLNVVVSKWNLNENFLDFIPFAKKYNFSEISFTVDMYESDKVKIIDNFNSKFREQLIINAKNNDINLIFLIPLDDNKKINDSNINFNLKQNCLQPWKTMMINCDDIRFSDLCYGIEKTNEVLLMEAWNSDNAVAFRKRIIESSNTKCRDVCSNNILDFQRFQM